MRDDAVRARGATTPPESDETTIVDALAVDKYDVEAYSVETMFRVT
jgi:hypothetical protein